MKSFPPGCLSLAITALGVISQAHGLEIRQNDASKHKRLLDFPGEPIYHQTPKINPRFSPNAGMFLGIGWPADPKDWTRQMALISPQHLVCATHYPIDLSWKIAFLGNDGKQHLYAIESQTIVINKQGQPTDLTLVTLRTPVDPGLGITPFPVLNLPNEADYKERTVQVCGSFVDSGTSVIKGFIELKNDPGFETTRFLYHDYDSNAKDGGPNDCSLRPGDSGGPNFILVNGKPALIGTNSGYDDLTPDDQVEGPVFRSYISSIPTYLTELDRLMKPKGYHVTRLYPKVTEMTTTVTMAAPLPHQSRRRISFVTQNSGNSTAHNVDLLLTFPTAPAAVRGRGWICERISSLLWECRRGGIAKDQNATITSAWPARAFARPVKLTITRSYDGSAPVTSRVELPVSSVLFR